jgi:hypothetical protein
VIHPSAPLRTKPFNYLQFRTASGGIELGTVAIDAQGGIQHEGYSPYGVFSRSLFHGGKSSRLEPAGNASGNFFTINESDGSPDIVFGMQSGLFADGTILALPQASSKTFDSTYAGSYTAVYYEKAGAQTARAMSKPARRRSAKGQ